MRIFILNITQKNNKKKKKIYTKNNKKESPFNILKNLQLN